MKLSDIVQRLQVKREDIDALPAETLMLTKKGELGIVVERHSYDPSSETSDSLFERMETEGLEYVIERINSGHCFLYVLEPIEG